MTKRRKTKEERDLDRADMRCAWVKCGDFVMDDPVVRRTPTGDKVYCCSDHLLDDYEAERSRAPGKKA